MSQPILAPTSRQDSLRRLQEIAFRRWQYHAKQTGVTARSRLCGKSRLARQTTVWSRPPNKRQPRQFSYQMESIFTQLVLVECMPENTCSLLGLGVGLWGGPEPTVDLQPWNCTSINHRPPDLPQAQLFSNNPQPGPTFSKMFISMSSNAFRHSLKIPCRSDHKQHLCIKVLSSNGLICVLRTMEPYYKIGVCKDFKTIPKDQKKHPDLQY